MRRITLPAFGPVSDRNAARVLGMDGALLAVVAEPAIAPARDALRDAVVNGVLDEDFGDVVLAGVSFADHLGGDAVGFT